MSILLAIEMSQRIGSVAFSRSSTLDSIDFPCGGRQDDLLLPSIDELLSRNDCTPDSIQGIGVSIGPGGFTGLRIAVATAKGIAEVTGCDLHAIPSAEVAAESVRDRFRTGDRVVVLAAAKQGSCWLTPLECAVDRWLPTGVPGLHEVDAPAEEVVALCRGAVVLADEHVPASFIDAVEPVARLVEAPSHHAEACVRISRGMAERGESVDPLELVPLYPREPEAVRLWRSRGE